MSVKVVSIKCSVCGASLENYHGQKEVKCEYCGNIQLVEPDVQQTVEITKPRPGLILIIVLVMGLGGGFASFYLQAPKSQQSSAVADSLNIWKKALAKDSINKPVEKTTNGDPLGK
jgi:DNA-directed RNA polymerase subunit RPC12/RpoP